MIVTPMIASSTIRIAPVIAVRRSLPVVPPAVSLRLSDQAEGTP